MPNADTAEPVLGCTAAAVLQGELSENILQNLFNNLTDAPDCTNTSLR